MTKENQPPPEYLPSKSILAKAKKVARVIRELLESDEFEDLDEDFMAPWDQINVSANFAYVAEQQIKEGVPPIISPEEAWEYFKLVDDDLTEMINVFLDCVFELPGY